MSEEFDKSLRVGIQNDDASKVVDAISRGADVNQETSSDSGGKLIHKVAWGYNDGSGHSDHVNMEILDAMLVSKGLEVNALDNKGETGAHVTARNQNLEAFKKFKEAGADLTIVNAKGEKPADILLEHAFLNGNSKNAIFAIENGAKGTPKNQKTGENIVHRLFRDSHITDKEFDPVSEEILDAMIKSDNFNFNTQDKTGKTVGHIIAQSGNAKLMKKMMDAGLDLSITDANGKKAMDVWNHYNTTSMMKAIGEEMEKEPTKEKDVLAEISEGNKKIAKEFFPELLEEKPVGKFGKLEKDLKENPSILNKVRNKVKNGFNKMISYIKRDDRKI